MSGFFKVSKKDSATKARLGEINTPHGAIATPAFVPVGTQATVKSLTPDELKTLGVQLFFVNTYHMYLRPGIEVIKKFGGLHRFMGWNGPLITDSGGFQVFSLTRNKYDNRLGAARRAFSSTVTRRELLAGPAAGFPPRTPTRGPLLGGPPTRVTRGSPTLDGCAAKDEPRTAPSPPEENDESQLVKITDEGVEFQSHWDGSCHFFTPERSIALQWQLGSDLHIAFDDCTPYPVTPAEAKKSLSRTHRWAERSLREHQRLAKHLAPGPKHSQALYGVVQGSVFKDLRQESAKFISSLDFDGIAIGGVSVGESKAEVQQVLAWVTPLLPEGKPRHLLGVGEIDDIFALVEQGIDTFDCVQPTRLARMGHLYTISNLKFQISNLHRKYQIDINKSEFAQDSSPIDEICRCYTCRHFSRAYLHHLFRVRELLAYRLNTIHNLHFVNNLMAKIRKAIAEGKFLELTKRWLYT